MITETVPVIESAVLDLRNEGMMPESIARKLGYPLHMVEDILEALWNQTNNVVGYVEGF